MVVAPLDVIQAYIVQDLSCSSYVTCVTQGPTQTALSHSAQIVNTPAAQPRYIYIPANVALLSGPPITLSTPPPPRPPTFDVKKARDEALALYLMAEGVILRFRGQRKGKTVRSLQK